MLLNRMSYIKLNTKTKGQALVIQIQEVPIQISVWRTAFIVLNSQC
jgi:hypothetical protein